MQGGLRFKGQAPDRSLERTDEFHFSRYAIPALGLGTLLGSGAAASRGELAATRHGESSGARWGTSWQHNGAR